MWQSEAATIDWSNFNKIELRHNIFWERRFLYFLIICHEMAKATPEVATGGFFKKGYS